IGRWRFAGGSRIRLSAPRPQRRTAPFPRRERFPARQRRLIGTTMPTYAIVESGGKQYRVEKGQSLLVDRISEKEGAKVPLRAVMFRDDDDTVLAAADLEKVKVEARVAGHERGEKIRVFKYKA